MTRIKTKVRGDGRLSITVEAEDFLSRDSAWGIAQIVGVDWSRANRGAPLGVLTELPAVRLFGGIEYHFTEPEQEQAA